jgi:ABC-type transport system involved in multi-copper enzyme maturation permease subunit
MKSILKYILKNGLRDRLYLGLFISLIITFAISIFLGSTMLIEQQQAVAAYVAGSSRVIISLGMILFVCLTVNRAFENKEIEFILSKSISRESFILGYLGGFFIAAFLIFLPLAAAILFIAKTQFLGTLIWLISLLCEVAIVISFSLLAALILKNPLSAIMASFAFYVISRLMGIFALAIKLPDNFTLSGNKILTTILEVVSAIFPRLDLFSQSSWLYYGISDFSNLKIIFWQSLIYIPLLIFMSFRDFKQKEF